jgi:hypothetical protein
MRIGTKIRITDPHSHYCGQIAWVEGDNQLAIAFAISIESPFIPAWCIDYYVETPDGQDIEHGWAELGGFEIVRVSA